MKPCWKDFLRKPLSNSISGLSQILSITIICSLPETETPMTIGDFVIAVACEDNDVTARKIYENQLHSLLASITHAAGYFHLDLTDDKILKIGALLPCL